MKKDAQKLINEALRFEALAKDIAFKWARSGQSINPPIVIDQHMLRAETLRAAAALISKP